MNIHEFHLEGAGEHADPMVREWLRKTVGDLDLAHRDLTTAPAPNYDAVCYRARQGAEKLFKAFLQARGVRPPRVDDLVHLDARIVDRLAVRPCSIVELSELGSAAIEARYPGHESTPEEAVRAVEVAGRLWRAAGPLV